MNNEVEAWLPERDPQAVLLKWYSENFPVRDSLFLSWDESSLIDPRVELLAAKLEGYIDEKGVERRGSPYVRDVLTPGESLRQMLNQKIPADEAVKSLTGLLVGEGSLKVRLTEAGAARRDEIQQEIVTKAAQQLGLQVEILPPAEIWVQPTEFDAVAGIQQKKNSIPLEGDEVAATETAETGPPVDFEIPDHDFQISWHLIQSTAPETEQIQKMLSQLSVGQSAPAVEESFFAVGSPIAIVVTLSDAGEADRATALADIRNIAAECFIPAETVHMGGRPVGSAMLNGEVAKAAYNPDAPWYLRSVMGLSSLVSCLLAFLMVKSFRLGTLVLTVSLFATMMTVALIPLTGSSMNMVLIVMPTLLSVLTLSGAIHVVSYWRHAAQHEEGNAVAKAIKMAAQPCFLASATTAIGLASLATSTLNPVRDFGIYAAIGCGISLVYVLFVLPSLMQIWPGKAQPENEGDTRIWRKLSHVLTSHATLVSFACLGVFLFGLYGLRYFHTETKVVRYFPEDAPIITDYWFLEDQVVAINTVDTIVRFDQVAQKELQFLERMEIVRQVTEKIRAHSDITGAISLADFQKRAEKPAENARFLEKIGYNKRSSELEERIKSGEINAANSMFTTAKSDSHWLEEGDYLLSHQGDELWRVSAQAYVMADNDYGLLMDELDQISASVLTEHAGTTHSVTGMVPVFLRTQEALLESLIYSFGMAFVIIAVVMMFLLRNPISGLISMLPNLMPVAFCFGTLSMMGISVDIGTMITASIALGIAVDGTLHLLTWFIEGIRMGKTRPQAIELALSHCAPAMCQTSAIVAFGLLMLAPAPLLMISRFGILMAALIGAALVADIIYLPALLAGALGKFIERNEKKRMERQQKKETKIGQPRAVAAPQERASERHAVAHKSITAPHLNVFKSASSNELSSQ